MHRLLNPIGRLASPWVACLTLEDILRQRHASIDALLRQAIDDKGVTQVVEIAAGLSGRALRFTQPGSRVTSYIECDLPDMATQKRQLLAKLGPMRAAHSVVDVDALTDTGPLALDALVARLDPSKPVAFITEGLVNYFDRATLEGMWRRLARIGRRFPRAVYLSDLHVQDETLMYAPARVFLTSLSVFARGRVHIHYADASAAAAALRQCGFSDVTLHKPSTLSDLFTLSVPRGTADVVRLIEAWT